MAQEEGRRASQQEKTAPEPDDPRKPDSVAEIQKPSWKYVLRKTAREFTADQATDLAAALTYYGTLAVFPALLALVSVLGLFSDPVKTIDGLLDIIGGLLPGETLDAVRGALEGLATSPAAGLTFVTGLLGALWSASGYVAAFSRAMNRIYSIQEGRTFVKLRSATLGVTVLAVVVAVLAASILVLSGPVARQVGDAIGLGEVAVSVWGIAKWPILVGLAVLLVAVLYYATPNVKQPSFRWMSMGALLALVTLVAASVLFAFYVANFSSYNRTYGSIGGVIVFLLWVWITNIALLFGAELDAELERGRQLQAGIKAEEQIQLPPRGTTRSDKIAAQHEKDVAAGHELRLRFAPGSDAAPTKKRRPDTKRDRKTLDALGRRTRLRTLAMLAASRRK